MVWAGLACRKYLTPAYRSARKAVSYSMAAVVAKGAKSKSATRVPPSPSNLAAASSNRAAYPAATESPPGPAKLVNSGPGMAKRKAWPAWKRRPAAAPGGCHVGSSSPADPLSMIRAAAAASSTDWANTDTQSSDLQAGTTPRVDSLPGVGLMPTQPLNMAGMRPEPAVSVPSAKVSNRAPMMAPEPEEEPPGTKRASKALLATP
mmetsp:Transcript_10739/g.32238  ORF Transcript_10739/g.32238 Transcript_10739/m.32238 type:complete len:205 (+) Transcript_10739:349-963(+)